jgi:pimeloyl-ACP methyl ester carboxylesterase
MLQNSFDCWGTGFAVNCANIPRDERRDFFARAYWMDVFSELRYPSTPIVKIFSGLLALTLFVFVTLFSVSSFLLYEILRPVKSVASTFNIDAMIGHPSVFSFSVAGGGSREGWFFPGLRDAPVIVVCHGYQSQRVDVLTLVTALQEHQYNVFSFDFSGNGTSPGITSLGYKETSELRSALDALAARDDVDRQHFGIWGQDMGGYAAIEVAAADPRVVALAVDDAYVSPPDMLEIQAKPYGLTALPFVLKLTNLGFTAINYSYRNTPPATTRLPLIVGPKLFVTSEDRSALADETLVLFDKATQPKRLLRYSQGYRDMSDDDRKAYESQIVNFFLEYMPPSLRQ